MRHLLILFAALLMIVGEAVGDMTITGSRLIEVSDNVVDMASPPDGRKIYVLTAGGELLAVNPAGKPDGSVYVGKEYDNIELLGQGERIALTGSKTNKIKIVKLDFTFDIPTEGNPSKGPAAAPVALVVFDDFECPYCARLAPTLNRVAEKFSDKVRFVFKNFPLSRHRAAREAATAGLAAERQGKFWPLHDAMFEEYNKLGSEKIREIAQKVGLDMELFEKDMADPELEKKINEDIAHGRRAGLRGTPALYLNGVMLTQLSEQGISAAIERELESMQ